MGTEACRTRRKKRQEAGGGGRGAKAGGPAASVVGRRRGRFSGSSTTETRTPTRHRANNAHPRVRMEGWRQRRLGSKEDHSTTKGNYKTDLTLTGLLMEGLGKQRQGARLRCRSSRWSRRSILMVFSGKLSRARGR